MKNKHIIRMCVILIITVIAVACGVLSIVYAMTYRTMMDDIRNRAIGVKDYILENLYAEDLIDIGINSPEGIDTSIRIREIHNRLKDVGNLLRLYVAAADEQGKIITSQRVLSGDDSAYTPEGVLEADLLQSLRDNVVVMGSGIYKTNTGDVYSIFWPVSDQYGRQIGAVSMEFDVSHINTAHRQTTGYSAVLSGVLLLLIIIIAYLSISRATEPFYKKLAYTDILTGFENRMAFEHRLRECGDYAEQGIGVTLIICDVNNLKIINDTIGHEAGDEYIKKTAFLIYENLRCKESVYRIGGDEFASVLVGKKENEIIRIMTSLYNEKRSAYKTQAFSCACGYASFNRNMDETLRDTFKRADTAMYNHKRKQKGLM